MLNIKLLLHSVLKPIKYGRAQDIVDLLSSAAAETDLVNDSRPVNGPAVVGQFCAGMQDTISHLSFSMSSTSVPYKRPLCKGRPHKLARASGLLPSQNFYHPHNHGYHPSISRRLAAEWSTNDKRHRQPQRDRNRKGRCSSAATQSLIHTLLPPLLRCSTWLA